MVIKVATTKEATVTKVATVNKEVTVNRPEWDLLLEPWVVSSEAALARAVVAMEDHWDVPITQD